MRDTYHEPPQTADYPSAPAARPLISRGRAMLVHGTLVLFALAIVGRAFQLQLIEGGRWAQTAERQQVKEQNITPVRGRILDATGSVLVESREMMQLNISPRDLKANRKFKNPRATLRAGLGALNVQEPWVRRALDTTRRAVLIPALYRPAQVERFAGVPGVWRMPTYRRTVSAPMGIRGILGEVNISDVAKGGIEQELDPELRGVVGRDVRLSDGRGNRLESPLLQGIAARAGNTITLTLNQSLQEIAEKELALALQRTGASGGDVVMLDPRDGSVLVLAGARNRKPSVTSTALTEPYEPGSVMKPFLVARLLDDKRATPDEIISLEGGSWTINKRTINDEHKAPSLPVRDIIRFSSNIGVVKLAQRYTPREEYEVMRDFGFGSPTGVPFPAESRGRLTTPKQWTVQSPASIAMGYELSATALQIAVAYAAIANGGELLQPVLIKAIHDPDGNLLYKHQRRVVRRVLSAEAALTMRAMLESVVDSGTAKAAELSTFDVAGKSGTARRVVGRSYAGGGYNSTFAGMFPAQAPQYVFVARLIDPQGKIFGGTVSGGMINGILQAALATRDASLDRNALAVVAKPLPVPVKRPLTPQQVLAQRKDSLHRDSLLAPMPAPVEPMAARARLIITLPMADSEKPRRRGTSANTASVPTGNATLIATTRAVPTVYGLDLRHAVRTLQSAGFQVRIAKGVDGRTRPSSGVVARVGTTVVLESRR